MDNARVLIVDDEKDLLMLIADELMAAGYDVVTAGDGLEAVRVLAEQKIDVICSDVLMPHMGGNELLKAIRQDPALKEIPIIIFTARVNMQDYFNLMNVGAFIPKPFSGQALMEKIEEVLRLGREGAPGRPASALVKKTDGTGETVLEPQADAGGVARGLEVQSEDRGEEYRNAGVAKIIARKSGIVRIDPGDSRKKALILEGEPAAFRKLREVFAKNDVLAGLVSTAEECLEEARHFIPDVILLRDMAGQIRAEYLADQLKKNERLADVPIIIYSDIGKQVVSDKGEEQFILSPRGSELVQRTLDFLKK